MLIIFRRFNTEYTLCVFFECSLHFGNSHAAVCRLSNSCHVKVECEDNARLRLCMCILSQYSLTLIMYRLVCVEVAFENLCTLWFSGLVGFWQYVWCRTSTGGDADPGVALVPGACCHSPCHGVGALPGVLLLLFVFVFVVC